MSEISYDNVDFKVMHKDAAGNVIVDIASLASFISVSISPNGFMIFTDQLTGERWMPSLRSKEVNVHEHEQDS